MCAATGRAHFQMPIIAAFAAWLRKHCGHERAGVAAVYGAVAVHVAAAAEPARGAAADRAVHPELNIEAILQTIPVQVTRIRTGDGDPVAPCARAVVSV